MRLTKQHTDIMYHKQLKCMEGNGAFSGQREGRDNISRSEPYELQDWNKRREVNLVMNERRKEEASGMIKVTWTSRTKAQGSRKLGRSQLETERL
jgi:hypothetical protein